MRFILFLVIIGLGLTQTNEAKAFGKSGHITICEIAYRVITDEAREIVKKLIVADGEYKSFNYACLEEDDFPRPHPKDHFVNYPRNTKTITGPECPGGGDCILTAIVRDMKLLADTNIPEKKRARALFGLGHWVGDIHQPLHISFKDDKGGNKIKKKGSAALAIFMLFGIIVSWRSGYSRRIDLQLFSDGQGLPGRIVQQTA